ncbi:MAG: glycosyltransferase [Magnetococcales bacterium]|nr:glycosyltransferase [Magnetococcales bacterium]
MKVPVWLAVYRNAGRQASIRKVGLLTTGAIWRMLARAVLWVCVNREGGMRVLIVWRQRFRFHDEVADAFRQWGVAVETLLVEDPDFLEKLADGVVRWQPDFLFTMPISLPLSRLAPALKCPVVHWELDKLMNGEWFKPDSFTYYDILFSTYRQDVVQLRELGFNSYYLPFSYDIKDQNGQEKGYRWDVSFVGSGERGYPYRKYVEAQPDPGAVDGLFEPLLAGLMAAWEPPADFRARLAAHADLLERLSVGSPAPLDADFAASLLAKEAGRRHREVCLRAVPGVVVFGAEDWRGNGWEGMHYLGPVEQYEGSGPIFAASRINLSITRPHARCGLTDRIFNVLLSGGFLLTDRTAALLELFEEGRDLETFGSLEELADKVAFYLAHPAPREAIARRGAETVRAGHTFVRRIGELLEVTRSQLS